MIRSRYRRITIGCATSFGLSFAAITVLSPQPRVLWNASASAPIGLYYVDRNILPLRGAYVAIYPPPAISRYLARHHYLPRGLPLIKQIAALPGDHVCRFGTVVTVNGLPAAIAQLRDHRGRELPVWHGCRQVARNAIFLLNAAPDSLDGRYFGIMPRAGLIGRAHPIMTHGASGRRHHTEIQFTQRSK